MSLSFLLGSINAAFFSFMMLTKTDAGPMYFVSPVVTLGALAGILVGVHERKTVRLFAFLGIALNAFAVLAYFYANHGGRQTP